MPHTRGFVGDVDIDPSAAIAAAIVTAEGYTDAKILSFYPILGLQNVEYYVDSVAGSDSNAGTALAPFQTIQKALSLIPGVSRGKCRIYLIGAGPYVLPATFTGVVPVGSAGEPLMICGDVMTQVATGTVQSVSGATLTPTVGGMTVDVHRGRIYHGLTGTSAGKFYHITTNSATQFSSIGNTFGAAANDTFEILTPQTVLSGPDIQINGPGTIGFWRCKFTTGFTEVVEGVSVLFDACFLNVSGRFSSRYSARVYWCATSFAYDFKHILDIGTQSGTVGTFYSSSGGFVSSAVRFLSKSYFRGYIISSGTLAIQEDTFVDSFGVDIDNTGVNAPSILLVDSAMYRMSSGYNRLVSGGSGLSTGITVHNGCRAFLNAVAITNGTLAAVYVTDYGFCSLSVVTGSTGNGKGLLVDTGGLAENLGSNSVSGSSGAIFLDTSATQITWAQAPTMLCSPLQSGIVSIETTKTFASHAAITATSCLFIPVDTSGGAFTMSLPAANSVPPGWKRRIQDIAGSCTANPCTVQRVGSDTIPFGTSTTTQQIAVNGGGFNIQSDGTSKWFIT